MSFPVGGALVRHWLGADDKRPFSIDVYYKFDDSIAPADAFDYASQLALSAQTGATAAFQAWLASESRYFGATSNIHIAGAGGATLSATGHNVGTPGAAGSLSGDTLPDYVAAVLGRYTAKPGPGGRGRVFVPCVAEINTDTSSLVADGHTALLNLGAAFFVDIDIEPTPLPLVTFKPAHWSRADNTMYDVLVYDTVDILKRQSRRRLRGFA